MTSCRANMLGYIFQSMFRPTLPSSHEGLGDLSPVQWVHVHRKPCTLRDSRADFLGCAPPSMCTSISFCESCEISDAGFESRFEEHFFIIIVRLHDTSDVSRVLFLKLSYLPLYAIFILGKLQTFGCWWVSAWAWRQHDVLRYFCQTYTIQRNMSWIKHIMKHEGELD